MNVTFLKFKKLRKHVANLLITPKWPPSQSGQVGLHHRLADKQAGMPGAPPGMPERLDPVPAGRLQLRLGGPPEGQRMQPGGPPEEQQMPPGEPPVVLPTELLKVQEELLELRRVVLSQLPREPGI